METDMKESMIVSDLMLAFPPISKEDIHEVLVACVTDHYEKKREIINFSSIPDTIAGTALRIACKKMKSKKVISKEDEAEASEPKPKKAKKEKAALQVNIVQSTLPTIQ